MSNIKKAGVVGWPVSHSLSPLLHDYWLKKYNIIGEYKAYPVEPQELSEFIKQMRDDENFVGVNLTIPHKEAVMRLLDSVDASGITIGAVNTIVKENGNLIGRNTDAYGFAENIRHALSGIPVSSKTAIVLGAGGAAKAVIFALNELGFEKIIITNRTRKRAEELLKPHSINGFMMDRSPRIEDWEMRSDIIEDCDLLVNTTSLGMVGCDTLDIDLSKLPESALVTDIVYKPLITPLLEQARARGNKTIDGLGMLLHQAVPAFHEWFGVKPIVDDEIRQHILEGIQP